MRTKEADRKKTRIAEANCGGENDNTLTRPYANTIAYIGCGDVFSAVQESLTTQRNMVVLSVPRL